MKTYRLIPLLVTLAVAAPIAAALSADDTNKASALSQEGWQLSQSGKPTEATAKFREAVKIAPDDANAWNGLGWATFNSGDAGEGEKAFQKVIALVPDHPAALNGLGQIELSRREYGKAEPWLLKAAAQKASAAWHGLARIYLLQGKFADAEKWAQMVEDSGQGDAIATKMLQAAKAKQLSEGLRATIEPSTPASEKTPASKPNTGTLTLQKSAGITFNISSEKPQGTLTFSGEKPGAVIVNGSEPKPASNMGALTLAAPGNSLVLGHITESQRTPPLDAEAILLQIDLRVTLQHYEKLRTQLSETHMQRELFDSGAPEAPLAEAMARLKEKVNAATTKEEKEAAEERSRDFQNLENAKFQARVEVLGKLADNFRARIQELAKEIKQRTEDSASSKPQPATPKPTP